MKSNKRINKGFVFVHVSGSERPAIIDDDNLGLLIGVSYRITDKGNVQKISRDNGEYLQHLVVGHKIEKNKYIAFVNGDKLDCRKENLVVVDMEDAASMQYGMCKINPRNKLGLKGVNWDKKKKKYRAEHRHKGKRVLLEWFASAEEAAKAYDNALLKYKGPYANTNEKLGLI